ncbi:hypothetical protein [Dolichospermum compactum]
MLLFLIMSGIKYIILAIMLGFYIADH